MIIASGDHETLFADLGDEEGPLTITSRCNACGFEVAKTWAKEDRRPAALLEDGYAEGQRTAEIMAAHVREKHPERGL